MNRKEITEAACNLSALLKCLGAIDEDNITALRELPRAIQTASEQATKIYEALTELSE